MHDFVDEGDQSGDGKMTFEEFAAFVRSKEISLQNAYESLNPDAKGRIRGSRLKKKPRQHGDPRGSIQFAKEDSAQRHREDASVRGGRAGH